MVGGGGGEVYYMSRFGQCVCVYARATLERDIARERGPYWAFARVYAGARDAVRTSRRSMRSGRKLTHPHHPITLNLGQPSRPERQSRVQRTSVSPLATARHAAFTAHPHPHPPPLRYPNCAFPSRRPLPARALSPTRFI